MCAKKYVLFLSAWVAASAQTFTNPLFKSQDPYVTYSNGNYYYSDAGPNSIQIRKSPSLTGLATQVPYIVWAAALSGLTNIWGPEIHLIGGTWYIYFAADFHGDGLHRLYVLQGGSDPLGNYGNLSQIVESTGKWAIDPDVFMGPDSNLYLTWSCTNNYTGAAPQSICLARMSDPAHVASQTVQLSTPTETWETRTAPIEEGPIGFLHNGAAYITYSGSASWVNNTYSAGVLINSSGDMLNPQAWVKRGPILDHHDRAYGPGSVVFVLSPDGTELWNVYHGYDNLTCGAWACRSIRMQKVAWDADGCPRLGYPYDPEVADWIPSGDTGSSSGWGDSRLGAKAAGTWTYTDSADLDSAATTDGDWQRTFRGDPDLIAYSVSADVQISDGAGAAGLYGFYTDENNHVEAYIDAGSSAFVTAATTAGRDQGAVPHSLPDGFDLSQPHHIRIDKSADGGFEFFLDGVAMDYRAFALDFGQVGVLTSAGATSFRNVTISDKSYGWGDAYGDIAEGFPRDGAVNADGYVRGRWSIVDGATVIGKGLGTDVQTIYQGNPNIESFTATVSARVLRTGGTDQPGFALIACYDDRNNQISVWVHPNQGTLDVINMIQGQSSTQSFDLPAGFDATQPHTLSAAKTGALIVFSLDGAEVFRENTPMLNGMSGIATQDAVVGFEGFTFLHP